ncbi:hypothetical protein PVAP13_9NG852101, partial [Panicum virgatum]
KASRCKRKAERDCARGPLASAPRSSPCAPGPALQETRRGHEGAQAQRGRGRSGGGGGAGRARQARPSAAHLRLPPRRAAAGHGRRLLTRARKQGLPVWSPDRAHARATHAPASAGQSERSGLPRSRCVRHGGTGTRPAPRRQGAAARHGGRKRGTALRRCVRACVARFLVSLPGSPGGQRERGDQFPRPWREPQVGRHVYVTAGAGEPAEIYRIALRVCDRARSVRYKYPSSSLSGNKMCARKGFSSMTSGLIECAQCIEFSRVPP